MSQSNYPPGVTEADIDQAAGMNGPWECDVCACEIEKYDDALAYNERTLCQECYEYAEGRAARDALEKLIGMLPIIRFQDFEGDGWLWAYAGKRVDVDRIRTADDLVRGINELHRKLEVYKAEQAKDALLHAETMRWAGMTEEAIATLIKAM